LQYVHQDDYDEPKLVYIEGLRRGWLYGVVWAR